MRTLRPTGRFRLLVVTGTAALLGSTAAAAMPDAAGNGFRMPSKLVTCGYITQTKPVGLYCGAPHIKQGAYDGIGVVLLPLSGKARYVGSGNDLMLYIGGWNPQGNPDGRPTLAYGSVWQRAGYRCTSKMTGLECRRGEHGFLLSKEKIKLF